jgi:hypothetical protein
MKPDGRNNMMKKTLIAVIVTAVAGTTLAGLKASEAYHLRQHEPDEGRKHLHHTGHSGTAGVGSGYLGDPAYALYKDECGDCHLAYPPAMLPAASWHRLMGSLDEHFGDNAELPGATATEITAFLERHAAGRSLGEYSVRMNRATRDRTPLRITETDYFIGQHHEIPRKMVADNPDIQRFSRCEACHASAADGLFDEHAVRIPGYGRWDD